MPSSDMLTLRRTENEPRIEIMPMIDVIFLLLTFFIYAMVLMVRAELLPLQLPEFASGEPATIPPAVTISIDHQGRLFLDREPITVDEVVGRLRKIKDEDPETVIFLAAQERGTVDRLPLFLELYDELAFAGLEIKLVGRPSEIGP